MSDSQPAAAKRGPKGGTPKSLPFTEQEHQIFRDIEKIRGDQQPRAEHATREPPLKKDLIETMKLHFDTLRRDHRERTSRDWLKYDKAAILAVFANWKRKVRQKDQKEKSRQIDNTPSALPSRVSPVTVSREVHQKALPAFGPVVPALSFSTAPAPSNVLQPGPHVPLQPFSSAPPSPRFYPSSLQPEQAPPVSPRLPSITNMLAQLDRPAVDSGAATGHRASQLNPFTSQSSAPWQLPQPNSTPRGDHILNQPLPVRFAVQTQPHNSQRHDVPFTHASSNTPSQQSTSQQRSPFTLSHRPGQPQASQQHPPTSSGAHQHNP